MAHIDDIFELPFKNTDIMVVQSESVKVSNVSDDMKIVATVFTIDQI